MKYRKYLKIILFIVLIIGFFFSVRYNESSRNARLKKNGKRTIAKIVNIESGNKANYLIVEFLNDSGEKIQVYHLCEIYDCTMFLNKKFEIIYNTEKPSEHVLLYRRVCFESMDMPFPDSLRWVDQYEKLFNFKNAE